MNSLEKFEFDKVKKNAANAKRSCKLIYSTKSLAKRTVVAFQILLDWRLQ